MKQAGERFWNRIAAGLMSIAMVFSVFTSVTPVQAEGSKTQDAATYSFTASNLTASADKETIPAGTAVDDQGAGTIITFGEVVKRTDSDGNVKSVEAGKAASSGFSFTINGKGTVSVGFSSTGGSNTSAVGIMDDAGNVVPNNEGITTVTGTGQQTLTYSLGKGTYKVVSPLDEANNRGARVYAINVIDEEEVSSTKEEAHHFTATGLTASADKEEIPDGTIIDDEAAGYFKTFGAVTKRWNEEKGVTSVEVGKALSSGFVFTVTGTASASVAVSSTGGSNTSAVGIIDDAGNIVPNNEGITAVTGTGQQTLTYSLGAGTYKVVSPFDEANNRGARVYTIEVVETVGAEPQPVEDSAWEFRYFGVSTGADRNFLVSSGEGIEKDVVLASATFKEDGAIDKKGGKFVADSPADGGSYYFTTIDPTKQNFYFQADVHLDQVNPTLDGQEGFALMARDALGQEGVSGNWMANMVSVGGTKLPTGGVNTAPEVKGAIGIRAYTGIYTPEASEQNEIQATRYSWSADENGVANEFKTGDTFRVSLEKTDGTYVTRQYDLTTNEVIGEYVYYIPAKDADALTVSSYSELNDPLTFQEANTAYLALVVARGCNATFSNIRFTTSEWNAQGWQPQPSEYRDATLTIASGNTASGTTYDLIFRANADGTAKVFRNNQLVQENIEMKADQYATVTLDMTSADELFRVEFTPDPEFKFSAFEKLSSYDMISVEKRVTAKTLGKDGVIYAKKDGVSSNGGTSMDDAVDVETAFAYVSAGQTILLASETYDLSGKELLISRGHNGTQEQPITVTTVDGKFATFDFGGTGRGVTLWGNYWNMSKINVTKTTEGIKGMQLAGNYCVIERMNFFNNGTTGLQVSGISTDDKSMWPSYNTIKNCTSVNNADKAVEDADGFAAKLTTGDGNVFDGCIAAYNADDGWDLFAKVATGQIGAVTIKNSLTYMNGYLRVKSGSTKKDFVLADVYCDDNGTLTFAESEIMDAGNGNGFKMGGSSLPGGHTLINSISYDNKAKGIDSNSCSDIKAYNCTTYNNESYNVAMYTGNTAATTGYAASGVLSYRSGDNYVNIDEQLKPQSQSESEVYGASNYYWDKSKKQSLNTLGTAVSDDWFISLDTSVAPTRKEDGSIDMHGLLLLTDEARATYGTGARGFAWGQSEATVWVVGDSTVSPFNDKYYLPREGYGEEISNYFMATVYNLARSGASSKDFTTMDNYTALIEGNATVPALGDADTENFLVIGFGHNDEKTEEARFTDPNGDYKTEGSFANSLYVNYIKPAIDRGVTPVVCTPIARLTKENTRESYNGASGHITSDVVIGDKTFPGGNYAQAILDMVAQLQAEGVKIEVIDLTKATIEENVALGDNAQWLHSFTGAKYDEDGVTKIPTGLDQTHTNSYGAKMSAWMISDLSKATAPEFNKYSLGKEKPTYEEFFEAAINPGYVVPNYKTPTEEQMNSVAWPQYTDGDGNLWRGSVFGDVGGANKITTDNFNAVVAEDNSNITVSVANNCGKIAGSSDGLMFYYTQLPVGTPFTLTAKAKINSFFANNQVSFGLMARDDLYIDEYVATTMGDYVAAAFRNQGAIVNYGRKSGALVGDAPTNEISMEPGTEVDLKIAGTSDGFTLSYGNETASAGFDYPLTGVDSDYMYVGFYVVRNANITFSDIHLVIQDEPEPIPEEKPVVEVRVEDKEEGTAEVIENADGTVTLKATASEGYAFLGWKDAEGNIVSTDVEYTFTPEGNITLTAAFEAIQEEDKYFGFKLADGTPWELLSSDLDLYWYEDGVKQGVYGDPKNIWDVGFGGFERGREIFDPNTNAWYWLDAIFEGAVAKNKEVWMPYVFQGDNDPNGKWVRYDKYGEMIKGWYANDNGVYYYGKITGAMYKGEYVIDGKTYFFDLTTGIRQ